MREFVDGRGRTWRLEINPAQGKRVRRLLEVDLLRLLDDGLRPLSLLLADAIKLVDVLFALVVDQAQATGVSDDDFGRAMRADCIQAAAEALTQELLDFFPETGDRFTVHPNNAKGREGAQPLAAEKEILIDTLIPDDEARRIVRVRRCKAAPSPSRSA